MPPPKSVVVPVTNTTAAALQACSFVTATDGAPVFMCMFMRFCTYHERVRGAWAVTKISIRELHSSSTTTGAVFPFDFRLQALAFVAGWCTAGGRATTTTFLGLMQQFNAHRQISYQVHEVYSSIL